MAQSGVIASPVSSPYHQRNRTPPKHVPKFCQALSYNYLENSRCFVELFCALLQYLPGQVLVPDAGTPYLLSPPCLPPVVCTAPGLISVTCDAVSARCLPALSLFLVRLPCF